MPSISRRTSGLGTENAFVVLAEVGDRVFNQPAGHWQPGETLPEASAREALEESGCTFVPRSIVGVYRWHSRAAGETYLRFAFCGELASLGEKRPLDEGILRTLWLSVKEIRSLASRADSPLRSPLVLRCVEDYLARRRYPLELVTHFG